MSHNMLKVLTLKRCRWIALILLLAFVPTFISCYGHFPLTKAVYRLNADVTYNKIVRSLLFWGLVIVPVYEVSMLGDAVVFNLIEFWTGNILHIGIENKDEDSKVTLKPLDNGTSAELTVSHGNEIISQLKFFKVSDRVFHVYDENSKLCGMVIQTPEGDLKFSDEEGRLIHTIKAEEITTLSAS
jgi:hypothetical protein